jgi:ribosomal protein S6E (S10)
LVEDGRVHTKKGCQAQKELRGKKIRKSIKVVVMLIKYGDETLKWGW